MLQKNQLTQAQLSSSKGWTNCSMPFNSQTLTIPALMQHALTVISGHKVFLLGTWLSKIKSKGNCGSILILLDVSFVVYILDYYMYQIDLNLNNWHILTF